MLAKRASEILQSRDTIWVLHQDAPVWIESVDQDAATAQVTVLGQGSMMQVSVADLYEVGKVD